MKRFWALILALCLLAGLIGCAAQHTNIPAETPEAGISEPEVPSDHTEPTPPQEPPVSSDLIDEPLPEPVFSAVDNTVVDQLAGNTVTITTPTVELPSADAAESINRYFELLSGKVQDYAEGDLSMQPGVTCTVIAGHKLTWVSDTALSFLWTVETTTTSAELPGSTTVSAVSFDPGTGKILTFRDVFGDHAGDAKELFVAQARAVIAQREANYYYFDEWNELAATALDESCFYLAEEGVCVFYPREALGTYTEVLLNWDALSAHLAIKP